jgi:hypothetical protein
MEAVPFDSERWTWDDATFTPAEHLGRRCVRAEGGGATLGRVELADGVIELDLAVTRERAFPGVFWRQQGDDFESFFVRPHQVGNPDAIQYTPAFNGISSWQLYHGPGYWAPIVFPIDGWFTIRLVFAGTRAEAYVADLEEPALRIGELRLPASPGRIGLFLGGASVHLARFAYGDAADVAFHSAPPDAPPPAANVVPAWLVSDSFREDEVPRATLDPGFLEARAWTRLASEPSGPRGPRSRERAPRRPEHGPGAGGRPVDVGADQGAPPRIQRPCRRLPQRHGALPW